MSAPVANLPVELPYRLLFLFCFSQPASGLQVKPAAAPLVAQDQVLLRGQAAEQAAQPAARERADHHRTGAPFSPQSVSTGRSSLVVFSRSSSHVRMNNSQKKDLRGNPSSLPVAG